MVRQCHLRRNESGMKAHHVALAIVQSGDEISASCCSEIATLLCSSAMQVINLLVGSVIAPPISTN